MSALREPSPGRAEVATLVLIVAFVAAAAVRACLGPEERTAFLLYDDAYYYLGVARNVVHGAGSTFDGINPTNGYHPLWLALLLPVFLVTDDPGVAVRAAGLLWFLFAALAPIALWRALRPRSGASGALVAAAAFALHPFVGLGLQRPNGLETPLYAVAIATYLAAFERTIGRAPAAVPPRASVLRLGLLLGLVILARLDAGLLAVASVLLLVRALAGRVPWPALAARVLLLALGATLVAGPSLAHNWLRFGHPVPVSGRVVSRMAERERQEAGGLLSPAFARQRLGYGLGSIPGWLGRSAAFGAPLLERRAAALAVVALSLVLVALGLAARRRREGPLAADGLALLAGFAALHYAACVLWLWSAEEEFYRLYYFMPEVMLVAAALGATAGPWLDRMGRGGRTARLLPFFLALLAGLGLHAAQSARFARMDAEAGAAGRLPVADRHIYGWLKRNLPAAAVLAARDAGKLGFFSGFPVVNLDGLSNDQRLLAALAADREAEYICASPIGYLLYDRAWLFGYDPARPEVPPPVPSAIPRMLHRLAHLPGCSLRPVPGTGWVVLEVVRDKPR